MSKYGMYPQPVYQATLDDGRVVRMTVWQKADATDKGFDWERARRGVSGTSDYSLPNKRVICTGVALFMPPTYAEAGRAIVAGHMEQEGRVLSKDPNYHVDAKCQGVGLGKRKKVAVSRPQLRQWLDSIIKAGAGNRDSVINDIAMRLGLAEGMAAAGDD